MNSEQRRGRSTRRLCLLAWSLIAGLAIALPGPAWAQIGARADGPAPSSRRPFARPETPRRAERMRSFDVRHIKADLALDVEASTVRGTVTHTIAPLQLPLAKLELDCGTALKVAAVKVGPELEECRFEQDGETLRIRFDRAYEPGQAFDLAVSYSGSPPRGIHFVKPKDGDPDVPLAVWTQGEAEETHDWLPCYDYPNDRATSEMIVRVPRGLFALSNGKLVDRHENGDGTCTFHWTMDVPHPSYLISLAVSDFAIYHDALGDLPVDYYVAKSAPESVVRSALGKTPRMIAFFGEKTGVAYPYPKYAQAFVPEFLAGGMENISATTLTDQALGDAISLRERNIDSLVAHELAHQWFGDLLTCRDWSHVWLNEGFASYFDALFEEYDQGEDAFRLRMDSTARSYFHSDKVYRRPIVESRYDEPDRMFDSVTYAKGACVLHCLRGLLGDDVWWQGIRLYVTKNQAQLVTTDDLRRAMESASGQDLGWFFAQWTAQAGHPELTVRWRYEPADRTVRIKVRQVQNRDDGTPLFRLPTTLVLTGESKAQTVPIVIDEAVQEFVVPAAAPPRMVELDQEGWLLKEFDFEKEPAELLFQLEHATSVVSRLDAARALARCGDAAATRALASAWRKEKDASAQAAIVEVIAHRREPDREALRQAAMDRNPRVRIAALAGLAKLKADADLEALLRTIWSDAGEVSGARIAALRGLAGWRVPDRPELLAEALKLRSYEARIAAAALELLLEPGAPQAKETAARFCKPDQPAALRRTAVTALGRLAQDDPALQDDLIALIDDPERSVRAQAWSQLARLGTKRALPALEARFSREEQFARQGLREAIARLKAVSHADPGSGEDIAAIEREAAEHELRARELRHRAEGLKLKAERARRISGS